jgi:hypothetical protein
LIPVLRAFVLSLVLAAYTSIAPTLAADSEVDGWKLTQWEREIGILDVYFTKSSVRLFCAKNGLTIVASAPWKDVSMYCSKTGNVFSSPMDKFRNPYLNTISMFDGGNFTDIKVVLKGQSKQLDLACQTFIEPPNFSQRQLAKYKNGMIIGRAPFSLEFVTTNQFNLDPQVGRIISRFYALPQTDSVPIRLTYTSVSREAEKQLTTSACKKIKMKASDFKVPPGLKQVKDGQLVIVPDNEDGALDLMMMGRSKVK